MRPQVEILAPAGSMESMKAAIQAGADAVYMGGSRFGARAYADNPEEDGFLQAIDYAHIHKKKLYMTVNTLVKEEEMGQLYDFLLPYYCRGLDGAIVQDLGVLSLMREYFPKLPVHASTQMTVTGYRFARFLKEKGATRVVTARELSLGEIARIGKQVDIEIESFVHGALCYCYSGQCLLSSLIGGRSGNRGRCAQPCRLPYEAEGRGKSDPQKKERKRAQKGSYLMNLKDLCTLDILPDILEAGVYSLKIEGRMKSPRYTAGVVCVYRKYVDQYLERGRDGYQVDPADKRLLLELFDRGGFTDGYYKRHNGRDMIALGEKPAFREVDQELFDYLDREYVNRKRQEPVRGRLVVREGEPVLLKLGGDDGICVTGSVVQTAKNQPMTKDQLLKQMHKTGESPFYFSEMEVELFGNCFLPVQELNSLRRKGLEAWEQRILEPYRRTEPVYKSEPTYRPEAVYEMKGDFGPEAPHQSEAYHGTERIRGTEPARAGERTQGDTRLRIHVSLEEPEGLKAALACPDVDEIYLDACGFAAESWEAAARSCRKAQKACGLILPHIFREKAEQYFTEHIRELRAAAFDELIVGSLEEPGFLREQGIRLPLVFDANLYGMNRLACSVMREMGAARLTFPLELNEGELERLTEGAEEPVWELVAYGHLPAMVSAQCIRRTTKGCSKQSGTIFIKDRTGKKLPVKNHCRFCYNTIYNPDPLSLLGMGQWVKRLAPKVLRLSFTIEAPEQIQAVLEAYGDCFCRGKEHPAPFGHFTRGHFRRGVE